MENDNSLSEKDVSIGRRVGRRLRRNLPRIRSWGLLGIAVGCVSTVLARLPGFSEISILGLIKWSTVLLALISFVGVLWLFVCEWLAEQKRNQIGPEVTDATASPAAKGSNTGTWSNTFTWSNPWMWFFVIAASSALKKLEEDEKKGFLPPGQVPRMTTKPDRRPGFGNQIQNNQSPPPIPKNQVDVAHGDTTLETKAAVTELYWAEVYVPIFHFAFINLPTVANNWEIMRDGLSEELEGIEQKAGDTRYADSDAELVSMVVSQIAWQRKLEKEIVDFQRMVKEFKRGAALTARKDDAIAAPVGDLATREPISQEEFESNIESFVNDLNRYIDDPTEFPEEFWPVADKLVAVFHEQDDRLYEAKIMQVRMQERYQGRAFDLPPIPIEEEGTNTN